MTNGSVPPESSGAGWHTKQVYAMAVICLLLGVALGYLFRGSESRSTTAGVANPPVQGSAQPGPGAGGMQQMPTLDQMKQMADKQAEPLLAKLQNDPKNSGLLVQIGRVYESTHQFKEAASYYQKSLDIDPKNATVRTEMASCLYYTGDVDGALTQLQQSLKENPEDVNTLFNLGMVRWQGKTDAKGAVAAWEQLLKSNPKLDPNKKAQVQKLIADARRHGDTP